MFENNQKQPEQISYRILQLVICVAACVSMLQTFYAWPVENVPSKLFFNVLASASGLCFMLSGRFLLAQHNKSIGTFYVRRLLRILPPFLVMAGISLISQIGFSVSLGFVKDYVRRICCGTVEESYWFLYSLLGFYLLAPFFAHMMAKLSLREKRSLFVLLIAYFFFFNLGVLFGYRIAVSSYPFLNWTAYALLGYLVDHIEISPKVRRLFLVIAGISLAVSSVECICFPGKNWSLDSYCLTRAWICIGIFLLFGQKTTKTVGKWNPLVLIARGALGAYLFMPAGLRLVGDKITEKGWLIQLLLGMLLWCIGCLFGILLDLITKIGEEKA